jgi:hypothetical protein
MMFGAIHIYRIDEGLLKPERLVRLLIKGCRRKLVVYNAPIAELDVAERLLSRVKSGLGPDPLSRDWSRQKQLKIFLGLGMIRLM